MSIKLDYILKRNRTTLDLFISKNQLTSYKLFVEYCQRRKFIPCSEKEYEEVIRKKPEVQDEQKVSRKASEAQKPKKRRYRRKKQ